MGRFGRLEGRIADKPRHGWEGLSNGGEIWGGSHYSKESSIDYDLLIESEFERAEKMLDVIYRREIAAILKDFSREELAIIFRNVDLVKGYKKPYSSKLSLFCELLDAAQIIPQLSPFLGRINSLYERELEQTEKNFSNQSLELGALLKVMRTQNLRICSCRNDIDFLQYYYYYDKFGECTIEMSAESDIFSFLSPELLESPYIALSIDKNTKRQVFSIYGSLNNSQKESIMLQLANNILAGRKQNDLPIESRLPKTVKPEIMIDSLLHMAEESGISRDDLFKLIIPARKYLIYGSLMMDEYDERCREFVENYSQKKI